MKVLITGSVTQLDSVVELIESAVSMGLRITEVVSFGATPADRMAELWARNNNIPVKKFDVDIHTFGNMATCIRNVQVASYADALILFLNGSDETQDLLDMAVNYKLQIIFDRT